jgi:hypothetical protein
MYFWATASTRVAASPAAKPDRQLAEYMSCHLHVPAADALRKHLLPTAIPQALVRTRVEPKTFFANERTFLQWCGASLPSDQRCPALACTGPLVRTSIVDAHVFCRNGKLTKCSVDLQAEHLGAHHAHGADRMIG